MDIHNSIKELYLCFKEMFDIEYFNVEHLIKEDIHSELRKIFQLQKINISFENERNNILSFLFNYKLRFELKKSNNLKLICQFEDIIENDSFLKDIELFPNDNEQFIITDKEIEFLYFKIYDIMIEKKYYGMSMNFIINETDKVK